MIYEILNTLKPQNYVVLISTITGLALLNRLPLLGRIIVLLLLLNLIADVWAAFLWLDYQTTVHVYNLFNPIEQLITVATYGLYAKPKVNKVYVASAVVILSFHLFDAFWLSPKDSFHFPAFIFSGILIAILSYFSLKQCLREKEEFRSLFFWFSLANLFYYTLMVSAMSALPLAQKISYEFAAIILQLNYICYACWALTLTFGMIWNRLKTS